MNNVIIAVRWVRGQRCLCDWGRGFMHMAAFGGYFVQLAVVSGQSFWLLEVAALRRLVYY